MLDLWDKVHDQSVARFVDIFDNASFGSGFDPAHDGFFRESPTEFREDHGFGNLRIDLREITKFGTEFTRVLYRILLRLFHGLDEGCVELALAFDSILRCKVGCRDELWVNIEVRVGDELVAVVDTQAKERLRDGCCINLTVLQSWTHVRKG